MVRRGAPVGRCELSGERIEFAADLIADRDRDPLADPGDRARLRPARAAGGYLPIARPSPDGSSGSGARVYLPRHSLQTMKLTARFGDPLYSANGLFRIAQFQGTGPTLASRAGRAGDLRPGPATRYPAG
jgi:hypothetical protein